MHSRTSLPCPACVVVGARGRLIPSAFFAGLFAAYGADLRIRFVDPCALPVDAEPCVSRVAPPLFRRTEPPPGTEAARHHAAL